MAAVSYKEADMYPPIQQLLTSQGFTVRGEVKGLDIAAIKDDTLWAVEMKLHPNITLIYQAMDRQVATDWVFVAIPRPKSTRGSFAKFKKLVKKLGLGLIIVALDSPLQYAEIVELPVGRSDKKTKKARAIKKEIAGRTTDTVGGVTKTKINTAYRERCVRIACLLEALGEASAKELTALGCEGDTWRILNGNLMGWFGKGAGKGKYGLSAAGVGYLQENEGTNLVQYYRMKAGHV